MKGGPITSLARADADGSGRVIRAVPVLIESRRLTVEDLPVSLESRLRAHIARRDQLARELFDLDVIIAAESRRFADANRLTLRPTLPQLRRHLNMGEP